MIDKNIIIDYIFDWLFRFSFYELRHHQVQLRFTKSSRLENSNTIVNSTLQQNINKKKNYIYRNVYTGSESELLTPWKSTKSMPQH